MTDRAALRAAILNALPVDWDDRTTVVEVVPDDGRGHPVTLWGHPERLADAILAAIQPVLDEGVTVEWGIRCTAKGSDCWHDHKDGDDRVVWSGLERAQLTPLLDRDMYELVHRKAPRWVVA
jgi:hypothetical protein